MYSCDGLGNRGDNPGPVRARIEIPAGNRVFGQQISKPGVSRLSFPTKRPIMAVIYAGDSGGPGLVVHELFRP
jgi:hypothetical protein